MGTPFVNVTIDGLLWGYEDELPCLPLDVPKGCNKGSDPFSGDDDPFEGEDDGWDFKRRKRSLSDKDYRIVEKPGKIGPMHNVIQMVEPKKFLLQVLNGTGRPCPKQSSSTALATGDCSGEVTSH